MSTEMIIQCISNTRDNIDCSQCKFNNVCDKNKRHMYNSAIKSLELWESIIDKVESLPLYDDVPGVNAKVELFEVIEILQKCKEVIKK